MAGQYLLYGFLYVTAVEGAVISSSRILLAALLGPLLICRPFTGLVRMDRGADHLCCQHRPGPAYSQALIPRLFLIFACICPT